MSGIVALVSGILFALGLGYSGMTQTHIVKGFLDILGNWNLSLMGVMIGAIAVYTVVHHLTKNREKPLFAAKFFRPTKVEIDKRLVSGAALFGLGWGWAGICPGPGIVSLASGQLNIFVFVGSMLGGMVLFKLVEKKL